MVRPLVGGIQNIGYDNIGSPLHTDPFGNALPCTYTVNVYWVGERHWLTNSHCTRQRWDVTSSDEYYQSSINDGADALIGHEVSDPYGTSCGDYNCRYSDAAILELPADQTWNYGEIARTEFAAGPGEGAGSIVIDADNPRFIIQDEAQDTDFFEGLWLGKVGRTTGRTQGQIMETCADVDFIDDDVGPIRYECQEFTNYHSDGGDSGSPVHASPFGWPDVRLYGIHWAKFLGGTEYRIFSRLTGVQEDLGNLTMSGDEPTLSAGIQGPQFISSYGSFDYTANTSFEHGTVSYQWSKKFQGSSTWTTLGTNKTQTVFVNSDRDFDMRVEVQDDTNSDTAILHVYVTIN